MSKADLAPCLDFVRSTPKADIRDQHCPRLLADAAMVRMVPAMTCRGRCVVASPDQSLAWRRVGALTPAASS